MHTLFGISLVLYLLKLSAGQGHSTITLVSVHERHRLLSLPEIIKKNSAFRAKILHLKLLTSRQMYSELKGTQTLL